MKKLLIVILLMSFTMVKAQENPLLGTFDTPHETAPFGKIKNEHFLPAFREAISQGEAEIEAIVNNPQPPTFENTIEALERAGRLLNRTAGVFFNLTSAETSDELQQLAQEVSPLLTKFQNDISLNPVIFERVKTVYNNRENLTLTTEQQTLLEDSYIGFVRQGANLSDADKEKYREISTELSKLNLQFGENVLKETNKYELVITDKRELAGLPDSELEAAAAKAKSKNKEGWVFDLTMPSYVPFMKYADNRDLRKKLYMAYNSKSFKGDDLDNQENVRKIVNLRREMANLLGYNSYADYALERRMAMNAD